MRVMIRFKMKTREHRDDPVTMHIELPSEAGALPLHPMIPGTQRVEKSAALGRMLLLHHGFQRCVQMIRNRFFVREL